MKKSYVRVSFLLVVLVFASMACSFSASTANIASAVTARDPEGTEPTTVFAPDEPFYLIVELGNAPDDTTVKASWTAVDAEGVEPNMLIDEAELASGSGTLTFDLTNDNLWPAGSYKVDLYLNNELERTVEFSVEG